MTDFDHHYKIQKNAGFRLGYSLISAFFCDLWILLFVQPIVNNRYIDLSDLSYTAPMWQILNFHCTGARLKNHSRNLYAPLCSIFYLYSVVAARIFVKKNAPSHFWKCAFCLIMFPAIIPSNSLYCHATCFFSCLLRIEKQIYKQRQRSTTAHINYGMLLQEHSRHDNK